MLRPRSAQDVVQIVQYANERSLKVAIRGDGHCITTVGGKRYSPYSGVMSTRGWAAHFGPDVWRRLSAAKKQYDPNNVLSPGPAMFAAATE
ncbi:MAG TPA: hypothetical protein VEU73_07880 [Gemmatimonadales bacterium]|nr:hypothetical protein [Gemmatimonadales bacterium]